MRTHRVDSHADAVLIHCRQAALFDNERAEAQAEMQRLHAALSELDTKYQSRCDQICRALSLVYGCMLAVVAACMLHMFTFNQTVGCALLQGIPGRGRAASA